MPESISMNDHIPVFSTKNSHEKQTLLLSPDNYDAIQAFLRHLTAQQLDKEYPELAAILGLLIITDHPEMQQALPQESAFVAHLKIVQSALQAYKVNRLSDVDEALKQLPHRSAFRHFRTLLKAGIVASTAPAESQALLAKIATDSPYSSAAELLLASLQKGSKLAHAMAKFNDQQRRLGGEIVGFDKIQLELIEELSQRPEPLKDEVKFDLALQYRELFGPLAQRFCSAMLTKYPDRQSDFTQAFGAIDAFDENRLKALQFERENNSYDAEYHWKQCIAILMTENGNDLKIALILRRLAAWQQDSAAQNRLLIESLDYDPENRDSYLQILRYYSERQELPEDYEHWLTQSLDKFARDTEVLTQALQTAKRNQDTVKISHYAAQILQIDPLNTFAKQVLFANHLTRARRLIKDKQFDLIEYEFQQAEALKIDKSCSTQAQLMRALWHFAAHDKQPGLQLISEALLKLNTDPVNAHFQAAMEALLTHLPVATLLKDLPAAKEHLLSAQELGRLIQLLTQYSQDNDNVEYLHKALEKVKAPLKKSLQQQAYDESQLLALCQALDNIQHFELLRYCSKLAQAKWPKPIWLYYRIYSATDGSPEQCSFINSLRLQDNLDRAKKNKDHRAVALISQYLDRYHAIYPPKGRGLTEPAFEQEAGIVGDDPFEKLFGHLSDDIFYKIDKKTESLSMDTTPEELIRDLNKTAMHDEKILYAMMQTPDLYTALMILKAAETLNLNINVSFEAVLDCFGV